MEGFDEKYYKETFEMLNFLLNTASVGNIQDMNKITNEYRAKNINFLKARLNEVKKECDVYINTLTNLQVKYNKA